MLQALNLRTGPALLDRGAPLPPGRAGVAGTSVLVPAGEFILGVDAVTEPHSLDNERSAHRVDLPAFRIGRVPVTNGEWRQFIDDGGYDEQRWWSDRGWAHRQEADLRAPQFWNTQEIWRHPHPLRPCRGHPGRRTRPARHVLRSRGVRRVGRRAATHRAGVGEGLRVGSRGECAPSLSVGFVGADDTSRQPRRRLAAARAGGRVSGRCVGLRRRTDARRRMGMDHLAAAAVAGLHADALRAILSTLLRGSGPATTRCCAADRGRSHRASFVPASATGTTRSAGRSSRVCVWRGMSPDVSTPRLAR